MDELEFSSIEECFKENKKTKLIQNKKNYQILRIEKFEEFIQYTLNDGVFYYDNFQSLIIEEMYDKFSIIQIGFHFKINDKIFIRDLKFIKNYFKVIGSPIHFITHKHFINDSFIFTPKIQKENLIIKKNKNDDLPYSQFTYSIFDTKQKVNLTQNFSSPLANNINHDNIIKQKNPFSDQK